MAGPEDWVSNVWTRWQGCELMGRAQKRWGLVMGPGPCPVRGRRIPGQGGDVVWGDDRQVEEGRKGHVM